MDDSKKKKTAQYIVLQARKKSEVMNIHRGFNFFRKTLNIRVEINFGLRVLIFVASLNPLHPSFLGSFLYLGLMLFCYFNIYKNPVRHISLPLSLMSIFYFFHYYWFDDIYGNLEKRKKQVFLIKESLPKHQLGSL